MFVSRCLPVSVSEMVPPVTPSLFPLRRLAAAVLLAAAAAPAASGQGTPRPDVLPIVVSVSGRAAIPLTRSDSLDRAAGQGIGVRVAVWPGRRVGLDLRLDIDRFQLRTPGTAQALGDPGRVLERGDAVDRWDWAHWERTYNNSNGVRGLDPTFDATLRPIERARTLAFGVAPALRMQTGRLAVGLSAGPVLATSRRALFLRESWARTFPSVTDSTTGEPYVYRYTFDNNAPDKTAFALGLDAGLDARIRLTRVLHAVGGVTLRHFLWQRSRTDTGLTQETIGRTKGLPFNDVLGLEFGIALR